MKFMKEEMKIRVEDNIGTGTPGGGGGTHMGGVTCIGIETY